MILDTSNPRDLKAILLATNADTWEPLQQDGWFRIPSSDGRKSYITNEQLCSCQGNRPDRPCYHRKALCFYLALVRAQGGHTAPQSGYVQTESQESFERRTAPLREPRVAVVAGNHADIFDRFVDDDREPIQPGDYRYYETPAERLCLEPASRDRVCGNYLGHTDAHSFVPRTVRED